MAMNGEPKSPPPGRSSSGRLDAAIFAELVVLLLLPTIACTHVATRIDARILAGVVLAMSAFAFLAIWSDKRRAEAGEQRIPEATLHLLEFLGGWPGAFLAQRTFRHKTSKISYQVTFWVIVLVHQFVALDFLLGWSLIRGRS